MGEKKMRILWMSDSPNEHTGFGTVAKNLIDNICAMMGDSIEIVAICQNIQSDVPVKYNEQTTLYDGRYDGDTYDAFCRSFFINILTKDPQGFDGIFILQDFSIVVPMIEHLKWIKSYKLQNNRKNFKSFLYVPVDGYIHKDFLDGIEFFDVLATYTDYGKEQICRYQPKLRSRIKVIPHGANFKDFYHIPKEEIKAFREEFFGKNAGKIIFTNVNRNQPRKAIPDTIFAFIEAKKIWDLERKPFLYLNMQRNDLMGQDLEKLLLQTDLIEGEDYMIAPKSFYETKFGCDVETLNKIYNASDVFITTTLGEGWGLSITEAMSVRLPVICPYHTSLMHLSGGGKRARILTNLYPTAAQPDSYIREMTDKDETAEVMLETAKEVLDGSNKKMLDNAENFVRTLDWKGISKQFVNLFKETF